VVRSPQIGLPKIRPGEIEPSQIEPTQTGTRQVRRLAVLSTPCIPRRDAAAEHGDMTIVIYTRGSQLLGFVLQKYVMINFTKVFSRTISIF
jgi:hypothetical protein